MWICCPYSCSDPSALCCVARAVNDFVPPDLPRLPAPERLAGIVYVRASRVRQAEITCRAFAPPQFNDTTPAPRYQCDVDSTQTPGNITQPAQKPWQIPPQTAPARARPQIRQQPRTLLLELLHLAQQRSRQTIVPSSRLSWASCASTSHSIRPQHARAHFLTLAPRRFIGVSDLAAVRFSLPAQLLEPRPNLGTSHIVWAGRAV